MLKLDYDYFQSIKISKTMNDFIAVALKASTSRLVFINKTGEISAEAGNGDVLRFCYPRPYSLVYPKLQETVPVSRLPITAALPSSKIESLATGRPEEFLVSLGYSSPSSAPSVPTVALWTSIQNKAFTSYEIIYGGPDLEVIVGFRFCSYILFSYLGDLSHVKVAWTRGQVSGFSTN